MADRSRGDGWWEASDGKWYPPELLDTPLQEWTTSEQAILPAPQLETSIPSGLSVAAGGAVLVSAAAHAGVALAGLNLVSAMRSTPGPAFVDGAPVDTAEYGLWALAVFFSVVALLVAGVLVITWMFRSSKALTSRGASGMSWSPAWTIAGWFIPFANLVIPRLVLGELERIAQTPFDGVAIGDQWRRRRRFPVGDLWWLLWVGGNVIAVFGELGRAFGPEDDGRFMTLLAVTSAGYVMMAAAGVSLFMLIRSLTDSAND